MYEFKYTSFLNILLISGFLLIALISSEDYNLFYFISIVFSVLLIESYVRFLYLKFKKTESSYEGGSHTTIKKINESIILKFNAKKEDFKNKNPCLLDLFSNDIESKITWENDNTFILDMKVKKPITFAIDKICFAEKDLLGFEKVIYYFIQNKKKILFLPEAVRNENLESQIKKRVRKSQGTDYIQSIKEYESGDNFKHVNWKQSLKNDKLLINRFYAKENPEIVLYIDNITGFNNKDQESYNRLKENVVYLVNHSLYKNHIKTIVIDKEIFDLKNQKEEFLEKMIKVKSNKKLFAKENVSVDDSMLVLTTRNLQMTNKVIIRK